MGHDRMPLVILETDWSEDGADREVDDGPVGPDYSYRELIGAMTHLLGAEVDYAQFAAKEGFDALLRRFASRDDAQHLVVGGHGSPRRLHPPAGAFDVFEYLEERLQKRNKTGLLLASCELGQARSRIERLLALECFEWVAAYRGRAQVVFGPLTEIVFWRAQVQGWRWSKAGKKGAGLHRVAYGGGKADPIEAGILTKLEVASAVNCRFDVRCLRDEELVSSLEVFSALVDEGEIHDGGLEKVHVHPGSAAAVDHYRPLFDKVWKLQWEREVE